MDWIYTDKLATMAIRINHSDKNKISSMLRRFQSLSILCLALAAAGCSFDRMLVRASTPMIEGGIAALNQETDLELAADSIPANIEMMEGMIQIDPDNVELLTYAAQAYYGYAYGFNEDTRPQRAASFYRRGMKHGIHALEQSGAHDLVNSPIREFESQVNSFDRDDVPAMFWAASCWAKWIDIHRDQPEAIAMLPRPTALMQRVLDLDERFYYGGAHMYFGVYYGSRSPLLGGNYEKSEQHFDKARAITDGTLLIPDVLQAQYLSRQRFDQAAFRIRLQYVIDAPDDLNPDLAMLNQIAKRKAAYLLKQEKVWF
jgi:hypothetical protein